MNLSSFVDVGFYLGVVFGMVISSALETIALYYYHRELEREKAKGHALQRALQLARGQGRSQPVTSAQVFCRICGAQLQAHSNFCDKCGKDARI